MVLITPLNKFELLNPTVSSFNINKIFKDRDDFKKYDLIKIINFIFK